MSKEIRKIVAKETEIWQVAYPKQAALLQKFADKLCFEIINRPKRRSFKEKLEKLDKEAEKKYDQAMKSVDSLSEVLR